MKKIIEKRDMVYGKVICNTKKGCYIETECGDVFLPNYNFKEDTHLYGTVFKVPEEYGRLPLISLDSVVYNDDYLVA